MVTIRMRHNCDGLESVDDNVTILLRWTTNSILILYCYVALTSYDTRSEYLLPWLLSAKYTRRETVNETTKLSSLVSHLHAVIVVTRIHRNQQPSIIIKPPLLRHLSVLC